MQINTQTNKQNDKRHQVLLVFPRNDTVCNILQDACSQLEMDTFLSQTLPEAIESFQNITNGGHNLIIVDGRLPQILDPETVARYVKISKSSYSCIGRDLNVTENVGSAAQRYLQKCIVVVD